MPHIHEKIDFVVGAFIGYQNTVALVHHRKLKRWLSPGGHIELDEDPQQALFREISEETGLSQKDLRVLSTRPDICDPNTTFLYTPNFLDIHRISDTHRHVVLVYFLISKTSVLKLNREEHHDIRWFSAEDLDDPAYDLSPQIKFYAKEAIKATSRARGRFGKRTR